MLTVKRLPEFDDWLGGLKDGMTRIRLARRLDKVQRGLLGDVGPVGNGVSEMREHFGPGWRMYYTERKRWVKSMYWGRSNLVLMAQGATVEEYAYWEGMLFNAMLTYEIM